MKKFDGSKSPQQKELFPIIEVTDNDIPMGVLNDGTPYLTLYGLAKLCGIDDTPLRVFTSNWDTEKFKPRGQKVLGYLQERGYDDVTDLYTRVINKSNQETHAYPDYVCMAVLRYYALDATNFDRTTALSNFARLAEYTLKRMIYEKSNYDPKKSIDLSFSNYRARIKLNDQIPPRYFAVFREIADIAMNLIDGGFPMDDTTSLDGSVGNHWGRYWTANKLDEVFGERVKHSHIFPENYRQSAANKYVTAWIYPVRALGEFKIWLNDNYAMDKLSSYLERKGIDNVVELLEAVRKPELPSR